MQLTIIGCHAATPRKNAQTTAQLLEIKGHLMLIDCGEGTQMQLRKLGVKFARIQHIFISHLHVCRLQVPNFHVREAPN